MTFYVLARYDLISCIQRSSPLSYPLCYTLPNISPAGNISKLQLIVMNDFAQ